MCACSVAKLTLAETPGSRLSTFSMRAAQALQVMPVRASSMLSAPGRSSGRETVTLSMRMQTEEVSAGEFGPVAEHFKRLRIRERLDVLHRPAVNDLAHGELHDLAALG